ncbi:SDR family NAD(P)-dependent oxidoreductase [Rhodanobacter sp. 7MK24]|uniref:oxidoreductase n=1 Tax=Rhodanobacter sp. 7MK24 TaxID=2775922 RepID=UPI001786307F|nr:oxidoreductase [Rhodanobacter sp. 7MK24]MBD8880854.1 SDR family NAD(P)-dependent oxidoreductase [Rhodanobacter sp. 7MK24]
MKKKTWFVTGVGRGFGRALCEELLKRGHTVVGTVRHGASDIVHPQFVELHADVSDERQTHEVVAQAVAKVSSIDVVVNNAGFGMVGAVEEVSTAEARKVFETNFFGTWNVIRAALPHLRANGSGHIVNFSSIGGITGSMGNGLYNSSKFAVEGLSEALEVEVKPLGIGVTIVEPGYFRTDFLSSSSIQQAGTVIDAYAKTAGLTRSAVATRSGTQPGSPEKAVAVIIDAVESETPPLRLPLGPDAFARIDGKIQRLEREMAQWRTVASDTQFDT